MRPGSVAAAFAALTLGCASSGGPVRPVADPGPRAEPSDPDASVDIDLSVRMRERERAWLVAHLADDPDTSRAGESDAVRRLAAEGGDGVAVVAEVFRVGDEERLPFARRVVERVALARCRRDRARAGRVVAALQRGPSSSEARSVSNVVWFDGPARWPLEAVERVRAWGRAGAPCEGGYDGDGGAVEAEDGGA